MMNFRKLAVAAVLTAATLVSQGAGAATQGTLGATSTGTAAVSLTIAQQYQISGLSDLAFGTYSGSGALTSNEDVCVYTNDTTKNYHVLVTDSAGSFEVVNGSNNIPFTVAWNNAIGTTGNVSTRP